MSKDESNCLSKINGGKECKELCQGCFEMYKIKPTPADIDQRAKEYAEKQWPYEDFRGKNKGIDDEHTGQALRGACVGGYEAGYQAKAQDTEAVEKIIEELENMSNRYVSLEHAYVIMKYTLDEYIDQLKTDFRNNK